MLFPLPGSPLSTTDRAVAMVKTSRSSLDNQATAGTTGPVARLASTSRCPRTRAASWSSGQPHDPVRRRDRRKLPGVPHRVAGAADQAGGLGVKRLERSEGARDTSPHGVEGRVDDELDVVLPSDREMLLEHRDRVEVGGWAEGGVQHFHLSNPVDPVRPQGAA